MSNTDTVKNILISRDWFVDEYWFMARHHSETSSHTGPDHFRIVSEHSDAVKDLSGAGLIARILYELRRYYKPENADAHPFVKSLYFPEDGMQIDKILEEGITWSEANGNPLNQQQLFSDLAKDYELSGIGIWNHEDTDLIKHFIHAKCTKVFGDSPIKARQETPAMSASKLVMS